MTVDTAMPEGGSHASGVPVAATFWIGAVALVMIGIQPLLLGGLTEAGLLNEADLGRVATLETVMLAAASGFGPRLMSRGSVRMKTAGAMLLLAVVNALMMHVEGAAGIYLLRGLAGLAEGFALAACIAIQINTRHPDRTNALFFGVVGIPQIAAAYLLPIYLLPLHGVGSGYLLVALLALTGAACAICLGRTSPARPEMPDQAASGPPRIAGLKPLIALAFLAVILQNAGNGAGWTYVERLAHQRGLSGEAIGLATAAGLSANVLASFAVAWIVTRLPALPALVAGLILHAGVTLLLLRADTAGAFLLGSLGFNLFWAALLPFYVNVLIALDPSRRAALYLFAFGLIGIAVGPFLGSFTVGADDVTGAFRVAATVLMLGALCYALILAAPSVRRPAAALQ